MEQPITADDISRDLIHFIAKSPSTFHAVRGIKAALLYAGFTEIREEDTWQIEKGGKYVVTRNGSVSGHAHRGCGADDAPAGGRHPYQSRHP